jgi:hypothetical protein
MIDISETWLGMLLSPASATARAGSRHTEVLAPVAPGNGPHPVTVVGVAAAACLAFGWQGPVVAALVAVAILAFPGVLLVRLVAATDRAEAFVVVVATSVATWTIIAHVLLSVAWWHPREVAATVLGVLALVHAVVDARSRRAPGPGAVPLGPLTALRTWWWQLGPAHLAVLAIAFAVWAATLGRIDTEAIGDWGLIARVPVPWLVVLAVGILLAVRAATSKAAETLRVAAAIGLVTVVLYATLPLVVSTIRYPWSYKHLGVIRLLDTTGRLHTDVDIYNTFSGMFGVGALVRGATGVDPESYAAWWQLGVTAFVLVAVWNLVRRISGDIRVAHLATVVFLVADWVGQNYFSPQSVATFLGITVLALVCSWFVAPVMGRPRLLLRPRPLAAVVRRLGPEATLDGQVVYRPVMMARRWCVVLVFGGLLMTHALTPAAVLLPIGAAVAIGWIRDWRLLTLGAVVAVAWAVRCIPYFESQGYDLGFGGAVSDNIAGNRIGAVPPPTFELVGTLTRVFVVAVWMLAVAGFVRATRSGARTGMALLIAVTPFVVVLVNAYGGEAIYRVYLYSLPGVAALIAAGLSARRSRVQRPLAAVVVLALTAGFLVAHYGRERQNNVDSSEVAIERILGSLPDRQYVGTHFVSIGPLNQTATYPTVDFDDEWSPSVVEMLDRTSGVPFSEQLDRVADNLSSLTPGNTYLTVTPGMFEELRAEGGWPFAGVDDALALLATNPRFVAITHVDDSWLFRVLP